MAESRTAAGAGGDARWPHRSIVDVLGIAGLAAVVGLLLSSHQVRDVLPIEATHELLTLAAAAVGAGSAILAVVVSRLIGDRKPAWIAAALVLYCVVVLPWSTLAPTDTLEIAQRASRLVAYLTALVLLVLSVRPPRRLGSWGGWVVMSAGALLAVAALWLPDSAPVRALVEGPMITVAVLVGWTVAAIAFVVDGVRMRSTPRLRLGLGLVVLAVAQLYRVAAGLPSSGDLTFPGLRLAGLVIVLVGLAQLVQRALRALRAEQWRHQEELTAAALHMERAAELAAERNHELRNGLAGLAGITHLLSADTDGSDHERLKHAVLAELGRLHTILDAGVDELDGVAESTGPETEYLVEPVLAGLVTLRRSGGGRLELSVEPGLSARGHPTVLAQVVTNLLANCDRHAPGAPITVAARRADAATGDRVVVEVRDEGPGLPAGSEDAVLDRGVRDEAAGGSGLGLHISRQLIMREGGTLTLRTSDAPRGCLATVTVPLAAVPEEPAPVAAPLTGVPTTFPAAPAARRSADAGAPRSGVSSIRAIPPR